MKVNMQEFFALVTFMSTKFRTTISESSDQVITMMNSEELIHPGSGKKIVASEKITIRNNNTTGKASVLIEKGTHNVAYFDTSSSNLKTLGESIVKLFENKEKSKPTVTVETKKKGFFK